MQQKWQKVTWSETYFPDLETYQHHANNVWFITSLKYLKDDGVLYVPVIDKSFNKQGEEIK